MELVRKQENNENIVDIYIVIQIISIIVDFFIILGLLILIQFVFHSYFERKNDKVLTLDVVRFPNFEISASLHLSPPSNKRHTSQFQNLISAGVGY